MEATTINLGNISEDNRKKYTDKWFKEIKEAYDNGEAMVIANKGHGTLGRADTIEEVITLSMLVVDFFVNSCKAHGDEKIADFLVRVIRAEIAREYLGASDEDLKEEMRAGGYEWKGDE